MHSFDRKAYEYVGKFQSPFIEWVWCQFLTDSLSVCGGGIKLRIKNHYFCFAAVICQQVVNQIKTGLRSDSVHYPS